MFFRHAFDSHEDHVQMGYQRLLGACRVAAIKRIDHREMFANNIGQTLRRLPGPLEPRQRNLGGKDRLPDALAAGKGAEQMVERFIGPEKSVSISSGDETLLFGHNIPHGAAHLRLPERCDLAQQGNFQGAANEVTVLKSDKADRRDKTADLRINVHQPLLRQPLNGSPHRRARHRKLAADRILTDLASRRQPHIDDCLPQYRMDLIGRGTVAIQHQSQTFEPRRAERGTGAAGP